jgi:hypothetical protein
MMAPTLFFEFSRLQPELRDYSDGRAGRVLASPR